MFRSLSRAGLVDIGKPQRTMYPEHVSLAHSGDSVDLSLLALSASVRTEQDHHHDKHHDDKHLAGRVVDFHCSIARVLMLRRNSSASSWSSLACRTASSSAKSFQPL